MNEEHFPAGDKIRVLIVDDHAMVRQGLRTFLELQDTSVPSIEVAGEAANGLEAVELARMTQPDVVLLDLVMPGMDGIRAGAQGYLLKDIPPNELVHAVREIYMGKVQLHPEIAKKLMSVVAAQEQPSANFSSPRPEAGLTEREQEVLRLIAAGRNNREIAETLVISEKTVKTHVSNILSKLGLADRTQAAIFALRQGLSVDKD